MGLIFCFQSGLWWLDITDKFINDYGLGLVALVQAILIGWVIPRDKFRALVDNINSRSELKIGTGWAISLRFITPLVLGYGLVHSTYNLLTEGYDIYPTHALVVSGVLPASIIVVIAILLQYMKGKGNEG
jgi:NSS family neurotransmitter:Na+ symporter